MGLYKKLWVVVKHREVASWMLDPGSSILDAGFMIVGGVGSPYPTPHKVR